MFADNIVGTGSGRGIKGQGSDTTGIFRSKWGRIQRARNFWDSRKVSRKGKEEKKNADMVTSSLGAVLS